MIILATQYTIRPTDIVGTSSDFVKLIQRMHKYLGFYCSGSMEVIVLISRTINDIVRVAGRLEEVPQLISSLQ